MRVVLDTNVLISAHIKPDGTAAQILEAWRGGGLEVVVSSAILEEYKSSLLKAEVRKRHGLMVEQVDELIDTLQEIAISAEASERLLIVHDDPDDNKFFECALAGGAEFIVSGDRKVLEVGVYKGILVLPPALFLKVLEEETVTV